MSPLSRAALDLGWKGTMLIPAEKSAVMATTIYLGPLTMAHGLLRKEETKSSDSPKVTQDGTEVGIKLSSMWHC